MSHWIDVHTHLNMLEPEVEEIKQRCLDNDVQKVINIGTGEDNKTVFETSKKHFPFSYCSLGMHPHDAKDFTQEIEDHIVSCLKEPNVVAIGEIGLDYYYNHSPREVQIDVFRRFMELAKQHKLPVQIHTRDADDDTIAVLEEFKGQVTGIIHCFTGTKRLAEKSLECGFNISISGIASFKNAKDLRETLKIVPLDRLHVETDAPFLTPVPFRGKKNEPSYVVHVAEAVSDIHNISIEQLKEQAYQNALKMFPKLKN
ncbi:MAG: TatD family hydrolase [Bdellovibrionales bacterium]|nr:TatD family hydrolase [Bdellovibrionales bacterium]